MGRTGLPSLDFIHACSAGEVVRLSDWEAGADALWKHIRGTGSFGSANDRVQISAVNDDIYLGRLP